MGFFSKIFKGVKKVFKKIGKAIKKVFKKVMKAVGKLGIFGQIGLALLLPGVGGLLGQFTAGLAKGGGIISKIVGTATKFAKTVGNVYKTVTNGVSEFVKKVGGKVLEAIPGVPKTEGNLFDAFGEWAKGVKTDASKILDPWKSTEDILARDNIVPTGTGDEAAKAAIEDTASGKVTNEYIENEAFYQESLRTNEQISSILSPSTDVVSKPSEMYKEATELGKSKSIDEIVETGVDQDLAKSNGFVKNFWEGAKEQITKDPLGSIQQFQSIVNGAQRVEGSGGGSGFYSPVDTSPALAMAPQGGYVVGATAQNLFDDIYGNLFASSRSQYQLPGGSFS